MGRKPCCSKEGLNRGAWTAMEDEILVSYINKHGEGKWGSLPKRAGPWSWHHLSLALPALHQFVRHWRDFGVRSLYYLLPFCLLCLCVHCSLPRITLSCDYKEKRITLSCIKKKKTTYGQNFSAHDVVRFAISHCNWNRGQVCSEGDYKWSDAWKQEMLWDITRLPTATTRSHWRRRDVAGLKRCGKSCRLRWLNYLRPGIKRGNISDDEEELIIRLHRLLGNRCPS